MASTFNEQLARRASAAASAAASASASAKRQLAQRSAAIGNAAAAAAATTTTAATIAVAGGGGNSGELVVSEPEALAALEVAFREQLEALQQPADCGAAPLYLFVPHVFASGIGSQLRTVANSMMQARAAQHSRGARHTRAACCVHRFRPLTVHPCASVRAQAVVAGRTFILDDAIARSTFVDPRRCVSPGDDPCRVATRPKAKLPSPE